MRTNRRASPTLRTEVQLATSADGVPDRSRLKAWAAAAWPSEESATVVIRVVDEAEGAELNATFRHKKGATNVLSFPFEAPPGLDEGHLGDLVICAPVVAREAVEQGKRPEAHWAHMVVHGLLHLQGFDHIEEADARRMEAREKEILKGLGYNDPYE
ncbi:rRNA maturation RNase YbeY [Thioalkalivibrio denitrificans]|uniref:Endoribonuclease YbeY n=1 Tax=Thioalkalivibrio denitrificans TaxID=108003 RepID=A0A1V3NCT3_9GAMM|nr:rRNA maturation RNase YbeY [Thioalkalivibrio denitrificans]OOG22851.1 rRNA maturation RNase YbeY [Thioalkalivibrio denitrificans]